MRDYDREIVRLSGIRLRRPGTPKFPHDIASDFFDPKKVEPEFVDLDASYHINIPFAMIEFKIAAFTGYFITFFLHSHRPIHVFVNTAIHIPEFCNLGSSARGLSDGVSDDVGFESHTEVVAVGCNDLFLILVVLSIRFDADMGFDAVRANLNGFDWVAIGI